MTDDLLTEFRSAAPLPDEATAQRIYRGATSGRRRVVTRRRLGVAVAVLAAAGIAGGLSATLGGRVSARTGPNGATGPNGPTGLTGPAGPVDQSNPPTVHFTATGNEYTSIDLTIRSQSPEAIGHVLVFRSDASQVREADKAPNHVVFEEQVSMTTVEPTPRDPTQSTWSGTLTPSEWSGGCRHALYRITFDFGYDGGWNGGWTDWFQCKGPAVDPAYPFPQHFPG